jgi:hypothetical protein
MLFSCKRPRHTPISFHPSESVEEVSQLFMNDLDLFNCRRLPARLTIDQVASLLGFQAYEILILIRQGKIKCINHQSRNSRKYFHGQYILRLAEDSDFVEKASKLVAKVVRENNRTANNSEPATLSA